MASLPIRQQLEADPENHLMSHANRRRMDVEEIRDSLLAIEGSLDLSMGGTLQTGKTINDFDPLVAWKEKYDPFAHKRRTLYSWVRRSNLPALLTLFDYGDATTPGSGRSRTNVAPQALFILNSDFVANQALGYARKLQAGSSRSTREKIARAYMDILNRPASSDELAEMTDYLATFRETGQRQSLADPELSAWQSFCFILMASNEFLYLD
jgi:hypothetical protein